VGTRVPEIAVVDTHLLLWWLDGDFRKLGRVARAFCDAVDGGRAVACVSTLTLVELSEAIQSGGFTLHEPFSVFCRRLESSPARYRVAPLTSEIAARAHDLLGIPERGDRLIAATAATLDLPLLTRDVEIARALGRQVLWS
jgi:PIN domain nuclease of toxin-antitoxin system